MWVHLLDEDDDLGLTSPSRPRFRELARTRGVVPVVRKVGLGGRTPVDVYRALAGNRPGTFLMESSPDTRSWSRWSYVGVRSPAALTASGGAASWTGTPPAGLPLDPDPLVALREVLRVLRADPLPGLPPFTGGMVGYLGYDVVRRLERLPDTTLDDLGTPEMTMLLATDIAAIDHETGVVTLIANAVLPHGDTDYDDALARLDRMAAGLTTPVARRERVHAVPRPEFHRQRPAEEYRDVVREAIGAVHAGEAFQVVLSQRFEMRTRADALDVYSVLRSTNPSPYLYLLRLEGFDVVGSSPESLVVVKGRTARTRPIAGTRWRGADAEEDARVEQDLIRDPKERAEHLMLVDLGRNDLGRVCAPGTVRVEKFFKVEKYSHVMHIVSTVAGELAPGREPFDAVEACFPAGTLSGAPKPRAMELIDELEPIRRGLYGGALGYLDFAGDIDLAIAIRTALIRDGVAYVQAGAGVVADSDPAYEDQECLNKARVVLTAVAAAETLRKGAGGAGTAADGSVPVGRERLGSR
ncbi:anthranilate synthase component I [Saccharothrix lopnurensis]|uniref:Anthranilate synthase component 1 n=1 Tax=Saccharothrix lopnurensis TaxID=1670621 RepID=A0ABW1P534_9PSEU